MTVPSITPSKTPLLGDIAPVAVLGLSLNEVAARYPEFVYEVHDDLDVYRAMDFRLDRLIPVSLRCYRGHSQETVHVFLGLCDSAMYLANFCPDADDAVKAQARAIVMETTRRVIASLGVAPDRFLWTWDTP